MKTFLIILSLISSNDCVYLTITNRTPDTLWIGIVGTFGSPHLENGGFVLPFYAYRKLLAPEKWSGRIWARTKCDAITRTCETGDCLKGLECKGSGPTPPVIYAEFHLNEHDGPDFYGVSLLEGFNIPLTVEPVKGVGVCLKSKCALDLLSDCNQYLLVHNLSGERIGCHSSCVRMEENCCREKEGCVAAEILAHNFVFLQHKCPYVVQYLYNDVIRNYTCKTNNYKITFGWSLVQTVELE